MNLAQLESKLPFSEALIRERFQDPSFLIAYGSGVFPQNGSKIKEKSQVDFIVGVDKLSEWHKINFRTNRSDYTGCLASINPFLTSGLNNFYPGYLAFPYVNFDGHIIKYGVVDVSTLMRDLEDWTSFYFAGRLQKPIHALTVDQRTEFTMERNLAFALSVALDLSPETKISPLELFKKIAFLSYNGDIRTRLPFENPNKVDNIVGGNSRNFCLFYEDVFRDFGIEVDSDALEEKSICPEEISKREYPFLFSEYLELDRELRAENIDEIMRRKILYSSFFGTMKGLVNPGIMKGLNYVHSKRKKAKL